MEQENKIELTILMPCLNEAANIKYSISAAKDFLSKHNIAGEILVIDNGSTDNSCAIAKENGARIYIERQRGYGLALRRGIKLARGKYIIMGDCDSTYDFSNLMPFLTHLRQGAAMVIGNRFDSGIAPHAMPFSHKYIGVPFLSFLGRKKYKVDIRDFHCGLRGVNSKLAKSMNFRTCGMEFATEIIAEFARNNLIIHEIPTTLHPSKKPRKSHLNSIRDGFKHLIYILFN